VLLDVDPPRTHNLELLVDLLPDDWTVNDSSADLARLSLWLVESRYPGEWPEAMASDAADALAAARDVFARMASDLSARGVASAT
jgi:HEPN domain-containing protein